MSVKYLCNHIPRGSAVLVSIVQNSVTRQICQCYVILLLFRSHSVGPWGGPKTH